MSDFKVIETQEELDAIIKSRLNKEKEAQATLKDENDKLAKQLSELQGSMKDISEYDAQISELTDEVSKYKRSQLRTKIALEKNLPYELADRLQGADEDELRADAERMFDLVKPRTVATPLKDVEPAIKEDKDSEYKNLLKNLNLEGE